MSEFTQSSDTLEGGHTRAGFLRKAGLGGAALVGGGALALRGRARNMGLLAVACLVASALVASDAFAAQPPVGLGTADSFAVASGSTVTNTGPSTVNGDLAVFPGTAVTGFPPGTVNGTIHAADAVAGQAQSDLTTAYNDAAGRTPSTSVPDGELGGITLTPGVYGSGSTLSLTGPVTLDAQGDPSAVFIFQAGSSLITASGSSVNLINGAQSCNVFWQVGSSATLGTSSVFRGNILALTSISMNDGVTVDGRALARNGAVTLINDTITAARCATGGGTTGGGTTGGGTTGGGTTGGGTTGGGTTGGGTTGPQNGTDLFQNGTALFQNGTALFTTTPRSVAKTVARFGTRRSVAGAFRTVVTGRFIRQVVFSLGGRAIASRRKSPFEALVRPRSGINTVTARVTFTDGTPAATLRLRFRSRAVVKGRVPGDRPGSPSRPPRGPQPPGFTG